MRGGVPGTIIGQSGGGGCGEDKGGEGTGERR